MDISGKKLDQAKRHLAEMQALPIGEQVDYLSRLREEDSSVYSQVESLRQDSSDEMPAETIDFRPDRNDASTDQLTPLAAPGQFANASRLKEEFSRLLEAGKSPQIHDFLSAADEAERDRLLEELIALELQHGIVPREGGVSHYTERFPESQAVIERAVLHFDESEIVRSDDTTRVGEWPNRQQGACLVQPEEIIEPSVMFGEYEILREIARGGMGIVLEARQRSLNRRVALKMIRSGALADEEEVLRFRAEAEAAARLNHPQIVSVYEVGTFRGQHYFTMALVEGESLSARLRRGPLAPRVAAGMLEQVARGVHYAHDNGVVHRDLKPGNILLDENDHPQVADFGLAKQIDQDSKLTVTGCVLGTPSFMPPEQARGEDAGPHSDIYSLGAILYAALTNRPPFQAANAAETIQQVKEKEPVPPRQLNPAINQDLQTICLKCLEKNPARRYESAQDLADELQRFLAGQPILARPVSILERGWRWCVRHPAPAALLVVSVLAILALGFGFYFRQQSLAASELARLREKESRASADLAVEREKLAETQKYYSLVSRVRESIATRPMGWTWVAEKLLSAAEQLDVDSKDATELRSLIAATRSSFDLRRVAILSDVEPGEIAINPEGTLMAVATLKGVPQAQICVYDLTKPMPIPEKRTPPKIYYFATLSGNLSRFFGGDTKRFQERITALAFDPAGRWLVAGTRHGKIHAWDLASTGEPKKTWEAHDGELRQLTISQDGTRLYSCAAEDKGQIKSWDLAGDFALASSLSVSARSISLNHDDSRLIFSDGDDLYSVSAQTLQSPLKICRTHVNYERVTDSPLPQVSAAYIDSSAVTLIDQRDGTRLRMLVDPQSDNFSVEGLALSSTGLALASCDDDTVRMWDVASGELIASLGAGGVYDPEIAGSRNGQWLATTNAGITELYQVRIPTLQRTIGVTAGEIVDVEFTGPDQISALVEKHRTSLYQLAGSWLETWDVSAAEKMENRPLGLSMRNFSRSFERPSSEGRPVNRFDISQDRSVLSVLPRSIGPTLFEAASNRRVSLSRPSGPGIEKWPASHLRTKTGRELVDDDNAANGNAWKLQPGEEATWTISGDESRLVFASVRVQAAQNLPRSAEMFTSWVRQKGKTRIVGRYLAEDFPANRSEGDYVLMAHSETETKGREFGITAGPGVESLFLDGILAIDGYKLSGPPTLSRGMFSEVRTVSLSPDGKTLWGLGKTESLTAWTAPDWKVAHHREETWESIIQGAGGFTSLACGNRWLLIGHRRGEVSLHQRTDGKLLRKVGGFEGVIEQIAIHPSESFAVVGTSRGHLNVMELPSCRFSQQLDQHRLAVVTIDVSDDGAWLASGSQDQRVRVWRQSEHGFERYVDLGPFSGPISHVRFGDDPHQLAISVQGEMGTRLWDLRLLIE